jgi:hypothetical protein
VHQISQRTTLGDKHPRVDIASVFARAGIPGYIFMEGSLFEVGRAIQRMTTVFHNVTPRLVPLEQRVALLSPRNPLSRPIEEGQWVRVLHGLYRNDIGFVCGHDPSSDATAPSRCFSILGNKIVKNLKIFEGPDHIKSRGVVCQL